MNKLAILSRDAFQYQELIQQALNTKQLRAAVLDVFIQEPLPQAHPFWRHPNILISQHTAAISDPKAIALTFIDNYKRFKQGQALNYVLDFDKGY